LRHESSQHGVHRRVAWSDDPLQRLSTVDDEASIDSPIIITDCSRDSHVEQLLNIGYFEPQVDFEIDDIGQGHGIETDDILDPVILSNDLFDRRADEVVSAAAEDQMFYVAEHSEDVTLPSSQLDVEMREISSCQ